METTLKQRLIGAAVIIALAVIFIPMILDGSGRKESVELNLDAPPEPTFTFESQLPDSKQLDELPPIHQPVEVDASHKNKSAEPKSKRDLIEKVEESKVTHEESNVQIAKTTQVIEATENYIETNPTLSAWAVQVAAFGEKEKAVALQDKLLASNLSAFTEESGKGKKMIYRVKVGPELQRENAEKLRDKIEKEHGMKDSFVTKHP